MGRSLSHSACHVLYMIYNSVAKIAFRDCPSLERICFVYTAKSEVTPAISEQSDCINKAICLERSFNICLSHQCLLKYCGEHRNLHLVILPSLLLAGPCSIKVTHTLEESQAFLLTVVLEPQSEFWVRSGG